jgi:Uma2 family endonuclease
LEFRDGVLVDRNAGEARHSRVQTCLAAFIHSHERAWNVTAYIALTVKVRESWYALPDVCLYPKPRFEGRYPSVPPLLWVEVLSSEDRMVAVWNKVRELVANGVPYVWLIEAETLESLLWTASGVRKPAEKSLRLPDSPIVIPLLEVMED